MKCAKGDTASGKESHILFCNTPFCTTASAIVCKYVIRQPEQQEGMGGIENIEEIFQPGPLLPVISQHEWQRNDHHPLCSVSCS